jgi:hypothetical protein
VHESAGVAVHERDVTAYEATAVVSVPLLARGAPDVVTGVRSELFGGPALARLLDAGLLVYPTLHVLAEVG